LYIRSSQNEVPCPSPGLLMLWIPEVGGDILMTQAALSIPDTPRASTFISCTSSNGLRHINGKIYFNWFL
ncbi:hypothetical protein U0070_005488, partial [Myodes glareolus]